MKPVIAYICDAPGWAYAARVEAMAKALPDYVHQKVYAVMNTLEHVIAEAAKADIIVCMYVRYIELLKDVVDSAKVIACIGGKRPFEITGAD